MEEKRGFMRHARNHPWLTGLVLLLLVSVIGGFVLMWIFTWHYVQASGELQGRRGLDAAVNLVTLRKV